jgi:hypothetical protein
MISIYVPDLQQQTRKPIAMHPVRFVEILAYAEMCERKTLLFRLLHN